MNLILWLATGALVGLLASMRMSTVCRQRLMVDAVMATVGALLGGLVIAESGRWLSAESQWSAWAAAALGSIVLLTLVHLRERRSRGPE